MANIDVKAKIEAAKQAAKHAVAKHKRAKQPAVVMPKITGNPEVDSRADLDTVQKGSATASKMRITGSNLQLTANTGLPPASKRGNRKRRF